MHPSLPSFVAALSQPFKRSQLGLFHGKMKQYGNNVPFSKKKTRRTWLPNIQSKRLFSDALGEMVRVKVTTHALKTIRKVCKIEIFSSKKVFYTSHRLVVSTNMFSTQSRTCLVGRVCVYVLRLEKRRSERHSPLHLERTRMVRPSFVRSCFVALSSPLQLPYNYSSPCTIFSSLLPPLFGLLSYVG
jgi:large subunit ribosomal protein L28